MDKNLKIFLTTITDESISEKMLTKYVLILDFSESNLQFFIKEYLRSTISLRRILECMISIRCILKTNRLLNRMLEKHSESELKS